MEPVGLTTQAAVVPACSTVGLFVVRPSSPAHKATSIVSSSWRNLVGHEIVGSIQDPLTCVMEPTAPGMTYPAQFGVMSSTFTVSVTVPPPVQERYVDGELGDCTVPLGALQFRNTQFWTVPTKETDTGDWPNPIWTE